MTERGPWRKLGREARGRVKCDRLLWGCYRDALWVRSWRSPSMSAPAFEHVCDLHKQASEENPA